MGDDVPAFGQPQQLSLADLADVDDDQLAAMAARGDTRATIEQRFRAFHAAHPEIYDHLRQMALELVGMGHATLGIRMLWEVLRWRAMLAFGPDRDGYKLNDHYPSRYARLLMAREPELAGIFHIREIRAD